MVLRAGEHAGSVVRGSAAADDDGEVAAWVLRTGSATILWINERLVTSKADRNYVEMWYRLNAIARRRTFACLPASQLGSVDLTDHVFVPLGASA